MYIHIGEKFPGDFFYGSAITNVGDAIILQSTLPSGDKFSYPERIFAFLMFRNLKGSKNAVAQPSSPGAHNSCKTEFQQTTAG
jgi:hypothetical protein